MRVQDWIRKLLAAALMAGIALTGCSRTSAPQEVGEGLETQEQDVGEQAAPRQSLNDPSQAGYSGRAAPAATQGANPSADGRGTQEPRQTTTKPPAPPAAPARKQATLKAGTNLVVRTTNTLSTKTAQTGERFTATLEEPIMDGMWMIAPKGANVEGVIADADKGGKVKGVASLTVELTGLTTDDGQRVAISTNTVSAQAKQSKKKDAAKVGIGAGIGAAIGAIAGGGKGAAIGAGVGGGAGTAGVLLTKGEPAVIAAESVLNFQLAAPVTITERQ